MPLSDVVNVSITRETAAVAQDSFDIIAIMSREINSHNRVEIANTLEGVASLLYGGSGGHTYKIASNIFSQNPRPKQLALIPIKTVPKFAYTGDLASGDVIAATVNGTTFSTTYSASTDTTIGALVTLINAGVPGVTSSRAGGVFTVDSDSTIEKLSVSFDLSGVGASSSFVLYNSSAIDILFASATWSSGGSVSFVINGTTVTTNFNTDITTTMSAVDTALKAAFPDALADTVWNAGDFTLTLLTKDNQSLFVEDVYFTGITGTIAYVSTQIKNDDTTVTAVLNAAVQENNSWYGLVYASYNLYDFAAGAIDSVESANTRLIADWAESHNKLFAITSAEPNIVNQSLAGDSTTTAYYIKNRGYARSFITYTPNASASSGGYESIGAAILGKVFPMTPGSYNCKFKRLAGISAVSLTATQQTNADAKNVNTYILLAGVNIFQHGKVAEGEWIDTIIFADWIRSLIESNVYSALVNSKKIPFDDVGIGIIGGKVSAALESGVSSGGFTQHQIDEEGNVTGGYVVSLPLASEISTNDKNNRTISTANPISFVGYLAGAINSVTINGKVTV